MVRFVLEGLQLPAEDMEDRLSMSEGVEGPAVDVEKQVEFGPEELMILGTDKGSAEVCGGG